MNHEKLIAIGLILTLGLFLTIGCFGPFTEDETPENKTLENQTGGETEGETTDTNGKPAETVENFVNAMNEGNPEKAEEFVTESFAQKIGAGIPFEDLIKGSAGTVNSIEIENEDIENSKATVTYQIKKEDGSESKKGYKLIQENGEWKINDFSNLITTAGELLKEVQDGGIVEEGPTVPFSEGALYMGESGSSFYEKSGAQEVKFGCGVDFCTPNIDEGQEWDTILEVTTNGEAEIMTCCSGEDTCYVGIGVNQNRIATKCGITS